MLGTGGVLLAIILGQSAVPEGGSGGLRGGGPLAQHAPGHDCIPAWERVEAERQIALFEAAHAPVPGPLGYSSRATTLYDFWPQAGNVDRDMKINNFVDMNTSAGVIQDYQCTTYTYDGHQGHDCCIRSFSEQAIGVPIFAIKPGVVAARQDGNPDMNTTQQNVPANYVILDHGGNHRTWYWHMKNGSVAVNVGQQVVAGQQLGLTASSGFSNWPHLHFEVYRNGVLYRPFTGSCNPGASGWASQMPLDQTTRVFDFGFSRTNLNTTTPLPYRQPSTGQIALSDSLNYFWVQVFTLPPSSTWRVRYFRPNGTQAFDSGTGVFNNTAMYSLSWWWWSYNITDMHSVPGTWRMALDINGATVVNGYVNVTASPSPTFNRPPAPLTAVTFTPSQPLPEDVVFCRVNTSLVDDDPDYDLVKYEYVWTVNDVEVRRITSAAHSDALRAGLVPSGATLRCTVTPKDAVLSGPTSTVSVVVGGCGSGDFNGDGDFGTDQDIEEFFRCLGGRCCATCGSADFNNDGDFGTDQDIEAFFRVLGGGAC